MLGSIRPKDTLDEADVRYGLRMLLIDGILGQTMIVLFGGAFLVAFALLLGASNRVIGLLAAIGPAAQMLQLPVVWLVEKVRARKFLVVGSLVLSRLFIVVVALLPWFVPQPARLGLFLGALVCFFALASISGCSFNSWIRDLVPEETMGRYFAKRMSIAVTVGALVSLAAAFGLDWYERAASAPLPGFSALFLIAAVVGMVDVYFLARIPEPRMAPGGGGGLLAALAEPLRDTNFRRLLLFLGSWHFAVMSAAPFFTVYLLLRLELSMSWVIGLAVFGQLMNVAFLGLWGRLADRFTNKSVLAVAGPLFMISVLMWPFTTMPDRHMFTVPLLILIHALSGMSAAGVILGTGNIALKSAPRGSATAYLATVALVSGLAATLSPILAGFAADWFADKELGLTLTWLQSEPVARAVHLPALSFSGLDFLFAISFILGLYAMHRLLGVQEQGEVDDKAVRAELYAQMRRTARGVSSAVGMRQLTAFPFVAFRSTVGRLGARMGDGAGPPSPDEFPADLPDDKEEW